MCNKTGGDIVSFRQEFKKIQKDRKGVVDSEVYAGLKKLVTEIYPEDAHFIYELLQNAEDAKASQVCFEIKKNMLIFKHNGEKQFDADDIRGITNIGASTKKDNYVQAGKFGIGFKAVYAFTDTPSIYCDTVNFRIESLLMPVEIEPLEGKEKGWTIFVFPFDSPKISSKQAREKIKIGLEEIESTTLLFLNNITQLEYTLENGKTNRIEKTSEGNMVITNVYDSKNSIVSTSIWKRFSKSTLLHNKKVKVDIAFPMMYSNDQYVFLKGADKVCITFLAKNEKSNLRFFINAPFGCTPSRDTVNKDDLDNKLLVKVIANLFSEVINTLKEENMLTDEFFELLPLDDDEIPDFYQPIVKSIRDEFKNNSNLPTVEGKYVSVKNGIMSSRNVIDRLLSNDDIRYLYNNSKMHFVKNRPVSSRGYKFLKSLNIEELSPENILFRLTKLNEEKLHKWLDEKDDIQLLDLYKFWNKGISSIKQACSRYEDYSRYFNKEYANNRKYKDEYQYGKMYHQYLSQLKQIQSLEIIRTKNDTYAKACETYLVDGKITVPEKYMLVKENLYKSSKNSNAKEFLQLMGVKTFSREQLEKYEYQEEINEVVTMLKMGSKDPNYDVCAVPIKILSFLEKHKESEIKWKEYPFVAIEGFKDGRGKPALRKPQEFFLDVPFINATGFKNAVKIHNKKEISHVYMQLEENQRRGWVEFLMRQGALYRFNVRKISKYTGYATGVDEDYVIEQLERYLSLKNMDINLTLWNGLISPNGWGSYIDNYSKRVYQLNRNHFRRTEDSTVVKVLKNYEWVPDQNGKMYKPCDISRNIINKAFVVDENNGFLESVLFEEKVKKHAENLRKEKERQELEQVQKKEAAKTLGFASTKEVQDAKEMLSLMRELAEMGIDVRQMYDDEKKSRKAQKRLSPQDMFVEKKENDFINNETDYLDDWATTVKNPERTKSKIIEKHNDSVDQEKRKAYVKSFKSISPEEKLFLQTEYNGKCQVCGKIIIKKDGSRYFEAINLLDTSVLKKEYQSGIGTGWNTLCLCPNCAAEYNYGAVSLYDFTDRVKSESIEDTYDDFYEFNIQLQGENRILRYSPHHLFSLKTALEHFDDVAKKQDNGLTTAIFLVKQGDCCPNCGKSNVHREEIELQDKNGDSIIIDALKCDCGTIYLTKKLGRLLIDQGLYEDLNIEVVDGKRMTSTIKKKGVSSPEDRSSDTLKVCSSCGNKGTVMGSGLCWNCYKEYKASFYN